MILNANIIAREIGLKEKTETEHTGSVIMNHRDISEMTDEELEEELKKSE